MSNIWKSLFAVTTTLLIVGCGSGDDSSPTTSTQPKAFTGYYIDSPITNVEYSCGIYHGFTGEDGHFLFEQGKSCRLYIGSITLKNIDASSLFDGIIVFESDVNTAAFLQSLDIYHMYGDNIWLDGDLSSILKQLGITAIPQSDEEREALIEKINANSDLTYTSRTTQEAIAHLKQSLSGQTDNNKILFTDPQAPWISQTLNYNLQTSDINTNTNTNWVTTDIIYSSQDTKPTSYEKSKYTLLAWSELGMHCMDGNDYSVFSLLPPYSTLKAQLILNGTSPRIISSDVNITYEAIAKANGNINTGSKDKTNFWKYATKLFPNKTLTEDIGLKNKPVQQELPSTMDYNSSSNLFVAQGIPTVPYNDDGSFDEYPTVKVVAKDKNGNVIAQTVTTLPVSDELDCMKCHSSRIDILQKHDRNFPNAVKDYEQNLTLKGFSYDKQGLEATANGGTPILCASCHKSNAIEDSGIDGIKPLTEAIHGAHAYRSDPNTGELLTDSTNRDSCYSCHPGQSTKCLRGAMSTNSNIECQSCHGNMEAVAQHSRVGWEDEPNCQSCHQEGQRHTDAVTDLTKGTLRDALDKRFATEQTPLELHHPRLYKFSAGHGGIACAGCHGAQHAIYPSTVPEENKQNIDLQGYAGTLRECGVCHQDKKIPTVANGPHGMHTVGQKWVDMHGTIVLRDGIDNCKSCHGSDLQGTFLSEVGSKKTLKLGVQNKTVTFEAKEQVSCSKCHNNPTGEE